MDNLEKFNNAFIEVFGVDIIMLNDQFSKETADNWDSVRQLSIVTALEEAFDIMMDPEDILGFTSYAFGKTIMKKYNITL